MRAQRGAQPLTTGVSGSRVAVLRALPAAVALLAGLVVVPWAMYEWRHNPLPASFEPVRWIQLATDGYVNPDVVPDCLAIAIWIVWAQFLFAVLREIAARILRGVAAAPSAFVIAPIQRLACNLVAAISIVMISHPAGAAVPPLECLANPIVATAPGAVRPDSLADAGRLAVPTTSIEYVCGSYDTLRSLAATFYNDPDEWLRIRDASVGQVQDDGSQLSEGFVAVAEGTHLRIPTETSRVALTSLSVTLVDPGDDGRLAPDADAHAVRPGDVLWRIARSNYPRAHPSDLPQIVDAIYRANQGVSDGQGRRLHDPDLINPGMRLNLPTLGTTTDTGEVAPSPETQVAPEPDTTPTSAPQPSLAASPSAEAVPSSSAAPSLAASPDPEAPRVARPAAGPAPRSSGSTGTAPESGSRGELDHSSDAVAWLAGGGAGLLATGFLSLWAYRRRRRDTKVMPGQKLPRADPALIPVHTGIRVAADPTGPVRLDAALRSLAWLHRTGTGPIVQVLLRQSDGDIDVFLRDPVDVLPEPWEPTSASRIWRLPIAADLVLEAGADEIPHPNPALVQLGTTLDDADARAELYVDLEAIGILALDDETDATQTTARGIARALTATMATSPLADLPWIRTSGFDPYGLVAEERLHDYANVEDLISATTLDAQRLRDQLNGDDESTVDLRVRHPQEPGDPTVAIVVDAALGADVAQRLVDSVEGGSRGVALVLPARWAADATWRLVYAGSELPESTGREDDRRPQWRLDPLGISVSPLTLAANELATLGALLEEAAVPAVSPPPVPESQVIPLAPEGSRASASGADDRTQANGHFPEAPLADPPGTDLKRGETASVAPTFAVPDWKVMVRLLGTVDLVGANGETPSRVRDRTVETIAWLVLHSHGTRSQLESALWPTGARASTISNTLSRARIALTELAGPEAHGWIPGYQAELRIAPAVVTDLAVLQAHLDWATRYRDHRPEAIAILREGLSLVRGVPEGYPWLDAEHGSALTVTVTTAAILLAMLCLEADDTQGTLQATTVGLAVLPAHPELFALRMRARAREGDRAAMRAEYEAYLRAENADPLADGETDRDLERLYTQLVQR